ncbi:hypothetical protein PHYSODRAFT_295459 [Phytophthora sojae]|uniref:RxLR effector protein n=1 Tax=Phytophthora sojae (strain P6497) TaxID=1094619 RepID=G4YR62_PHYSP|nr:hypothetical protein PHYSODRAFT_295459 [Phytophthora sojae]EGZ22796.1 hypothetical protein PHYSODRAFT_295459 [Phytophthora sojae]|eukprot:XP_009518084.1 hypothetical protein PHYSODRAFT_295459 [Phytophthora sojae]
MARWVLVVVCIELVLRSAFGKSSSAKALCRARSRPRNRATPANPGGHRFASNIHLLDVDACASLHASHDADRVLGSARHKPLRSRPRAASTNSQQMRFASSEKNYSAGDAAGDYCSLSRLPDDGRSMNPWDTS